MVRTTKSASRRPARCRHNWDFSTTNWGTDGLRTHPCKRCPENLVIGTVQIRRNS